MTRLARQRTRVSLTAVGLPLALLALSLALAARVDAFVYWTNYSTDAIGRANLDGSGVSPTFISGRGAVFGIAADNDHVYWSAGTDYTDCCDIARADLDGTGVEMNFIPAPGAAGLAADSSHIFWFANHGHPTARYSAIGRADLDGSGVDPGFMTGFTGPVGDVAVDANHTYWAQLPGPICCAPGFTPVAAIGRANLDGSAIDPDFTPLPFASAGGLAVDGAHFYWVNRQQEDSPETIGRANLDGTGVNPGFIDAFDAQTNGLSDLAVDAEHIYWTDYTAGAIGRADLDGTDIERSFISATGDPYNVAVDALSDTTPPKTRITKGAPRRTDETKVKIRFKSSEPNSTFECRLDKKAFKPCTSPRKVKKLDEGKHRIRVRATDAAGNVDPTPAKDKFKVVD